jgi:hypothetical protein
MARPKSNTVRLTFLPLLAAITFFIHHLFPLSLSTTRKAGSSSSTSSSTTSLHQRTKIFGDAPETIRSSPALEDARETIGDNPGAGLLVLLCRRPRHLAPRRGGCIVVACDSRSCSCSCRSPASRFSLGCETPSCCDSTKGTNAGGRKQRLLGGGGRVVVEPHQPPHRDSDNLHGPVAVADKPPNSQADKDAHGSTHGLAGPDRGSVAQPVRRAVADAVTWPHREPYDHSVPDAASVRGPLRRSFILPVDPAVIFADSDFAAVATAVGRTLGGTEFQSIRASHHVAHLCWVADDLLPGDAPLRLCLERDGN